MFDYCTTYHSCNDWRLEEPRINDPDTNTAIVISTQLRYAYITHSPNQSQLYATYVRVVDA